MTDTTKPDLSREAVEAMADDMKRYGYDDTADMLRALLDAKEAAEREAERLDKAWHAKHAYQVKQSASHADYFDKSQRRMQELMDQLTEARAASAAAWEAGFEAGDHHGRDGTPAANPYATEAKHD